MWRFFSRHAGTRLYGTWLVVVLTWLFSSNANLPSLTAAAIVVIVTLDACRVRKISGVLSDIRSQFKLQTLLNSKLESFFIVVSCSLIVGCQIIFGAVGKVLGTISLLFILTHLVGHIRTARLPTSKFNRTTIGLILSVGLIIAGIWAVFFDIQTIVWAALLVGPPIRQSPCMSLDAFSGTLLDETKAGGNAHYNALQSLMSLQSALVHRLPDSIAQLINDVALLGEVPFVLPSVFVLYVTAHFILGGRPRKRILLQAPLIATVYAGVTSALIKGLVHRERPMSFGDPLIFSGPSLQWRSVQGFSKLDMSLPSGHVSVTLAVAHCLHRLWLVDHGAMATSRTDASNRPQARMGKIRSLVTTFIRSAAFYVLPCVTAISRASRCAHWPSDTIIGSTIGLIVAECVVVVLVNELQQLQKGSKMSEEAALQEDTVASTSRVLPS